MKKQQSGFTLIELIAVLVILGILAATAVPRFINLSDAAGQAAISNIAGSIESASSLNYAVAVASDAGLTTEIFMDTDDGCDMGVVNSMLTTALPITGDGAYTIAEDTAYPATASFGDVAICTITGPTGDSADFSMIYAVNP